VRGRGVWCLLGGSDEQSPLKLGLDDKQRLVSEPPEQSFLTSR
jgi:hypothetical protein